MDENKLRRQADPEKTLDVNVPLLRKSTLDFQYQPLDPSVDCTRILEFEPAEDTDDTPHCKLIHVTFAEKPKYEALSYMWGDQTVKGAIFVDGKEFLVGQNL